MFDHFAKVLKQLVPAGRKAAAESEDLVSVPVALRRVPEPLSPRSSRPNLGNRFCQAPFKQFDILGDGVVWPCCSSWVSLPLGRLDDASPMDIWNSEAAQSFRASIHDGSFRYCDDRLCPHIQNGSLPKRAEIALDRKYRDIIEQKATILQSPPVFINFCNDVSCNLSCPSCRTQKQRLTEGPAYEKMKAVQDQIVEAFLKEPTERAFTISVTGSGDPFASRIFRECLFGINGADFPNLMVNLQTNGVLFTEKNWNKLARLHDNLNAILISFDAATPETYRVTRRGGDWDRLIQNVTFLGNRRREGRFKFLRLDFVVQSDNFMEMPAFVRLAKQLGADTACFSMILDWGTWPTEVFKTKCIWLESHPRFREFLNVLKAPELDDRIVELGNLTALRQRALLAA
jgi:sulfatase maturation enzyme AslB (radical SAM superfamily)